MDKSNNVECPNCGNKVWFAFGTCISCGFNYISNDFTWIKVYVEELPGDCDYLIDVYEKRSAMARKRSWSYEPR